jgi:hypothetical protein
MAPQIMICFNAAESIPVGAGEFLQVLGFSLVTRVTSEAQ